MDKKTRPSFAEAVSFQKKPAENRRGPKRGTEPSYAGPLNYAYHFDAGKFGALLARHAKTLGVQHLQGRITDVQTDENGIAGITTDAHGPLKADFYVDCTGFAALLIGKALKSPFKSVKDVLLTDSAIATQVPYPQPDNPIESYTISTAHEAGWTWDIGLDTRRGVGYVYSSTHTTDARAETILRDYLGAQGVEANARLIRFDTGYREAQWVKNCAAVGLSGGFFEPLEATGIMMIEAAVGMLADFFPHSGPMDASAQKFNDLMRLRNEKTVNFLKLHYCVTKRQEPFWRDNASAHTIPAELQDLLAMWKHRPPSRFDILSDIDTFADFNYQYILYGMGFETDLEAARPSFPNVEAANTVFARIQGFATRANQDLPDHRALIAQIYANGFTQAPKDGLLSVRTGR